MTNSITSVNTVSIDAPERWTVEDALATYGVHQWGKGYFGINEKGHVVVTPTADKNIKIDLKELMDQLGVPDRTDTSRRYAHRRQSAPAS